MKANKKSHKEDDQAVSAVLGVILMVAISAAIAAVSFAYFTGMIGGAEEAVPVIAFIPNQSQNTLTVSNAEPNTKWAEIEIIFTNLTGYSETLTKNGIVTAGNVINLNTDQSLTGTVEITFRHLPSNTLLSESFTFQNVG
ncbi:MAG: type IV pilin [Thermoplasmatota archaeon]